MTPWIQDWVDALESGYFKHGLNPKNLWEPEGRFSALGVLCEINGCKRVALDLVSVRENTKDRMLKLGNHSAVAIEGALDIFMNKLVTINTVYYYTYNDDSRAHESISYIPISLTSKLDCNATLSLLNGSGRDFGIRVNGSPNELAVSSLSNAQVPFPVVAEFIRDVWPALTFKRPRPFTVECKDYDYFKLERTQHD